MSKKRYTAQETANAIVQLMDKYEAGELSERQARARLNSMLEKRESSIYYNADKTKCKVTFIKTLGKKRLKLLKQLIKERGEIDEEKRR